MGSIKRTLCGIVLFKLNIFCFHVWERSLVLILSVFCVRRVYRGSIFFSLVLILHICVYLGIKGDQFFSDLGIFLALVLRTNWCTTICITCPILRKIECIEFVCNEFVLVLVQIDLIQFENSNCIRSIWTKLIHICYIQIRYIQFCVKIGRFRTKLDRWYKL